MMRYGWMLAALVPVGAAADESTDFGFGDKPDHPQLPGVPWVVHDGTRPQPRKVEVAGAVVIPPPGDATVLFDGKDTSAWTANWPVKDGVMTAADQDILTKESFGAVQLHLEWRIPAGRQVKNQSGGNSGVFFMDRYEVQILESHDNKTYPDGQAGALYGQMPPLVNASAPQGDWQSYDIVFVPPVYQDGKVGSPARVTVIHNGVVVQNNEPYLGPTGWRVLASYPAEHPEKGPIRLQWHKDPIEFRNIWVRELGGHDGG